MAESSGTIGGYTVPPDFYQQLLAIASGDGIIVYSVGPDRKDDGGTLAIANPGSDGSALGFRLSDVNARNQPMANGPQPDDK